MFTIIRYTPFKAVSGSARNVALCYLGMFLAEADPADAIQFNRDIRPLLAENCYPCHGPDSGRRKADLRLDRRESAIQAGALVPGRPEESEVVRRIFETDPDQQMPPPESNRSLSRSDREMLKRWVKEGAEYQRHWAYESPVRSPIPSVNAAFASGNPIDAFIYDRLQLEKLSPAPEADPRTLIRRLSLDLLGLTPESRDVADFVAGDDPKRYETLVRRYLTSPHFGERMAIPWLDAVRFADTTGYHSDVPIKVWLYRDYVIDAFNRNLPFDQFTREQLAGDLLPNSTITQRIASGYNRLHRISDESGVQDEEYQVRYAADRVRTTATVWLGSTLGCAECHDHKFDPFAAKDFYRFAAIFADLKEKGAYDLAGGFTRENLSEETIFETREQKTRIESLEAEIARFTAEIESKPDEDLAPGRLQWEGQSRAALQAGKYGWVGVLPLAARSLVGTPLAISRENGSIRAGGANPVNDNYVITLPVLADSVTGVRVEPLPDPQFPGEGLARAGTTYFISEIKVDGRAAGSPDLESIEIAAVRTDGNTHEGHPVEAVIDGNPDTSTAFVGKGGGAIALLFAKPWKGGRGSKLTISLSHSDRHPYHNLAQFYVQFHTMASPQGQLDGAPEAVLTILQIPPENRSLAQANYLKSYYRSIAPELGGVRAKLVAARNERDYLIGALPSMPVSKRVEPRVIRVLPRGDWMDRGGEIVDPGVPSPFRQIAGRDGHRVPRLDLADWLVAPDNPLTARVFVNRLWRVFFGGGLTRTLDDLGTQGDWPSHPELLDWLAVEFRESGWNVKHLVELIVTSNTYRQSSLGSEDVIARDPENRLLARQRPFRLDAEILRDNALAISGLLVRTVGGPSAKPYQPAGYYSLLNFPRREYTPDIGEGLWRRGVYTHWQRTFLLPSFIAFDAASREECTVDRTISNTPMQALVMLNDPTYVEAARVFAERIMRESLAPDAFAERLEWAFLRAIARPPRKEEIAILHTLFVKQRERYRHDREAAQQVIATGASPVAHDLPVTELAAWTAVARGVLNLHETITRF